MALAGVAHRAVEYRAVDPGLYPRGDALVIAVARASGEGRQRASNTGGKERAQLLGGVKIMHNEKPVSRHL